MNLFFYRVKDFFLKIGPKWDNLAFSLTDVLEKSEKYINKEPDKHQDGDFSMEYRLASSGSTINDRYRGDRVLKIDEEIAMTVDKYKTSADIVVYRGVVEDVFKKMMKNAKGMKSVDLFEKGFMSTSLIKGCELDYKYKLRIFIPEGNKCVCLGNINDEWEIYYEVAIQHGASLKIISVDTEYINCMLIATA